MKCSNENLRVSRICWIGVLEVGVTLLDLCYTSHQEFRFLRDLLAS